MTRNFRLLLLTTLLSFSTFKSFAERIVVEWNKRAVAGQILVKHGKLVSLRSSSAKQAFKGNGFQINGSGNARLIVEVSDVNVKTGPEPTLISIKTATDSFSFLLRDVSGAYPIVLEQYAAVVLPGDDRRSYEDVAEDLKSRNLFTKIQQIEQQPEASFEEAAKTRRNMTVPIWLGISRDIRMFEISEELQDNGQEGKIIRAKYASMQVKIPEIKAAQSAYLYALGRGVGAENNIKRRLKNGSMPIYISEMHDDDIVYSSSSFVSFEKAKLTEENNSGTHYIVADKHSHGRSFKDEHKAEMEERMKTAYDFKEGMVLYSRTIITNTGKVPRYAWIKTPRPGTGWWDRTKYVYDPATGFSAYDSSLVFCISKLNGLPMNNEEMAVLMKPGEVYEYEFAMPHSPVSADRAIGIQKQSVEDRLQEAEAYWNKKLAAAGQIDVPEKRIAEMLRAGLLHLDLITFGEQPAGTLSANVGVYSPIGTESAPIIQYYLSMGWHDAAKRALNYFLDTQLESGYIQNYEGYTIETGAALWTMGEYYRYTQDADWIRRSKDKMMKSCNYLIDWRNKNKKPELKGHGYGMIDGKVADPEDHFHSFMLNGYGYLGLRRIAEVLQKIDPAQAERLGREAEAWRMDIWETVKTKLAEAPVVPLGDGRWVSTLPPWAEAEGPRALFQKREKFWSHGTFTTADALLGPLYLAFCEVLAADASETNLLLAYHSELFYQGNTTFSQPQYDRHNWLQAKLGMVKPFLSTYYNTLAAHADRETYTFWEHMFRVSPHKTHEEAWFLMETRWMLYMEDRQKLHLLKTIPRDWLADGARIQLKDVSSYFGKINLQVQSDANSGAISATMTTDVSRKPETVTIRLPHPERKSPVKVLGGIYNPISETVTIEDFTGQANVRLEYE